jgi:hypothetical protein
MSPALDVSATAVARDRRRHQRYPIVMTAHVLDAGACQEATTVDISTGGILLRSGGLLPFGRRVKVFIDWPVLLHNRCALRLVIEGTVIRSSRVGTAVETLRYDFHTRALASPPNAAAVS